MSAVDGSDGDAEGFARLAQAVAARRRQDSLTQDQVTARGGPSDRTLRAIENNLLETITSSTLRKLDWGLHWEPGTAEAVFVGSLNVDSAVYARHVASARRGANSQDMRSGSGELSGSEQILEDEERSSQTATRASFGLLNRSEDPKGASRRHAFRASEPLAKALASLQAISNPTQVELQAMNAVWNALQEVMKEQDATVVTGFGDVLEKN